MLSVLIAIPLWLLKSFLFYLLLIVTMTAAWRAYKILIGRRSKLPVCGKDAILISGATSGIGLALAKYLYKLGYSVFVGYYDSREPGFAQLKQLASSSKISSEQRMLFVELDVRSEESISKAYAFCNQALQENKLRLYALVNNAGLGSLQPFAWLQRCTIKNLVDTNLMGTLQMTREFLPLLIQSEGRILNVSSGLGFVPGPTYITYGITKQAQIYFTRCLNLELKSEFKVRSVVVVPHNYIKNTNICAANVKNNELAWDELKPLERQLYRSHYERHCAMTRELEKATKEHAKLVSGAPDCNPSTGSKAFNKRVINDSKGMLEKSRWWANLAGLIEPIRQLVLRLLGDNVALTLEESGTLECFEDALRLRDPPEHIFAGDNIYNLLVGSILLCVPASCIGLLSLAVSPSLYK